MLKKVRYKETLMNIAAGEYSWEDQLSKKFRESLNTFPQVFFRIPFIEFRIFIFCAASWLSNAHLCRVFQRALPNWPSAAALRRDAKCATPLKTKCCIAMHFFLLHCSCSRSFMKLKRHNLWQFIWKSCIECANEFSRASVTVAVADVCR